MERSEVAVLDFCWAHVSPPSVPLLLTMPLWLCHYFHHTNSMVVNDKGWMTSTSQVILSTLVVQCLVHDGCFLVDVSMRIIALHTLYPIPYVHLHARITHQVHPNTQRGQEVYSDVYVQKIESRKYLENTNNDYHSPHLLHSVRRVSQSMFFL